MATELLNRILTKEEIDAVTKAFDEHGKEYEPGTLGRLIFDMSNSVYDDGYENERNDPNP